MKIRISARRSDLARLQAYQVGNRLREAHSGLAVEYLFKESLGDKNQEDPLWKMPAQGVFTQDFVGDLLEGRTDLVVHSWKDLPTLQRPGLEIAATLERADPSDILLVRKESVGQRKLTLLTSSPRRSFSAAASLLPLLPFPVDSLETKPVRGNVLTRLRKLSAGEGDGLFLAKAALDRLLSAREEEFRPGQEEIHALLRGFRWIVLPLSLFPTAPAQGALAVEVRSDREELKHLLRPIHHEATALSVLQERKRFSAFGGGCHQKIGITVLPHPRFGWIEFFHGEPDGQPSRRSLAFGTSPPPLEKQKTFWPRAEEEIFRRVELANVANPGGDLFVARANALPTGWNVGESQLVWAAGVRTWQKLAKRGIWVHGCSDGLGEKFPDLRALAGRSPAWNKLTHEGSGNDAQLRCLATYRLEPLAGAAPPNAEDFFWKSESLFRWALAQRPEIRSARHSAGPGFTAEAIEKELGRSIEVYYNYSHWRTGEPTHDSD